MPLNTAATPLQLPSYEDIKENFVVFYASRDENGRMWCPVSALLMQTSTPPCRAHWARQAILGLSFQIQSSFAHRICHPPVSPPLGLPRRRRPRQIYFRTSRWPIWTDYLRGTKIRVRPLSALFCSISTSRKRRQCPSFVFFFIPLYLYPRWKTDANLFRAAPWCIESIPTIVKLQGVRAFIYFSPLGTSSLSGMFRYLMMVAQSKEVGRLVEGEIISDLPTFVESAILSSPANNSEAKIALRS
jgi:hypothetical protein